RHRNGGVVVLAGAGIVDAAAPFAVVRRRLHVDQDEFLALLAVRLAVAAEVGPALLDAYVALLVAIVIFGLPKGGRRGRRGGSVPRRRGGRRRGRSVSNRGGRGSFVQPLRTIRLICNGACASRWGRGQSGHALALSTGGGRGCRRCIVGHGRK